MGCFAGKAITEPFLLSSLFQVTELTAGVRKMRQLVDKLTILIPVLVFLVWPPQRRRRVLGCCSHGCRGRGALESASMCPSPVLG